MTRLMTPSTVAALQDPRHFPQHGDLPNLLRSVTSDLMIRRALPGYIGGRQALVGRLANASATGSHEDQVLAFAALGDAYRTDHLRSIGGIAADLAPGTVDDTRTVSLGFAASAFATSPLPPIAVDITTSSRVESSGFLHMGIALTMQRNRASLLRLTHKYVARALGFEATMTADGKTLHNIADMSMLLGFMMFVAREYGWIAQFYTDADAMPWDGNHHTTKKYPIYVGPRPATAEARGDDLRSPFEVLYNGVHFFAEMALHELGQRTAAALRAPT